MESLARMWWVLALRGILAIAFGVLVFFWPGAAWILILVSFAAYALIEGVLAIIAATSGHPRRGQWWALIIEGILGISAGVLAIALPGMTALVLLFVIAYWAIATGVFRVIMAIRLRKEIQGEWLLALSGVVSVLFGLALIVMPVAGALAVAWMIALNSILFGAIVLGLSFRLRQLKQPGATGQLAHS